MKRFLSAVAFLALASSLSFGANLASDPNYKAKCAGCHGPNGEGKAAMKTKPLKQFASKSDAELAKAIENGTTTAPKMPGYKGKLTDAQIKTLVSEIKALK
jgi:mono/diheme cytochrome c family protein